jgi:hypothetical protein
MKIIASNVKSRIIYKSAIKLFFTIILSITLQDLPDNEQQVEKFVTNLSDEQENKELTMSSAIIQRPPSNIFLPNILLILPKKPITSRNSSE